MRHELDHLAEDDPGHHGPCRAPILAEGRLAEGVDERRVVEEGKVDERGDVDGVHAPWLATPDGPVGEEGAAVGSPGGPNPAHTLAQEFAWLA